MSSWTRVRGWNYRTAIDILEEAGCYKPGEVGHEFLEHSVLITPRLSRSVALLRSGLTQAGAPYLTPKSKWSERLQWWYRETFLHA
jgi:hypothetical protein